MKPGHGAPGEAHNCIVNGNMVAGHDFLPVRHPKGETGVLRLIVGEAASVYGSDSGVGTLLFARAFGSFDPAERLKPRSDLSTRRCGKAISVHAGLLFGRKAG